MSLCVLPSIQGCGLGKALVDAFLKESEARGVEAVDLTTDAVANDSVNQFYRKLGFELSRTFVTPEGRRMNEYVISFLPNQCGSNSSDVSESYSQGR